MPGPDPARNREPPRRYGLALAPRQCRARPVAAPALPYGRRLDQAEFARQRPQRLPDRRLAVEVLHPAGVDTGLELLEGGRYMGPGDLGTGGLGDQRRLDLGVTGEAVDHCGGVLGLTDLQPVPQPDLPLGGAYGHHVRGGHQQCHIGEFDGRGVGGLHLGAAVDQHHFVAGAQRADDLAGRPVVDLLAAFPSSGASSSPRPVWWSCTASWSTRTEMSAMPARSTTERRNWTSR